MLTEPPRRPPGVHRSNVADLDDLRPRQLRAWAVACRHLRAHGLEPLPPAHVARALAHRGWRK